ncbi:hypothetical protein QH494_18520 [Sphingomonas sp. AR_OL41]|uniref:hypothetical protein n=1 Tax=Sphingomonas sp. AR_OL41 TaxID=3042729 RepID=UPI00248189DC|nr:hypothetical protein [Sphingomonas sp. AR_OL41]MDH7974188.1 hypothetical protein [Sphingomonas sp. AR_OL41]
MKSITTTLVAAAMIALAGPWATGAVAQSVNQRERNLHDRIAMGVRNGSLTNAEASRLRTRLANVQRLEWRYRRNGLTNWERQDLDRRFNALSNAIVVQRHDRQTRWHRR